MSSNPSPQPDGSQQTYRRLKLVMSNTEPRTDANDNTHANNRVHSRSSSPARPSYSPVTPTLSNSSANAHDSLEPEWIDEPDPLPVSMDENPDAIALQATLSLLQMQRQQNLRDIRGLNKTKQEALQDPESFVNDLKAGKLSKSAFDGITLDSDVDSSDEETEPTKHDRPRFGKLPVSQNIARCPPIEWSKYGISGEPLDRLHNRQRQYPGITEERLAWKMQPQQSEVIAPYRPFSDRLDSLPSPVETRNYDK